MGMSMTHLEFDGIAKSFGNNIALWDFSLTVQRGEVVVLLGPSGCGKSTALRLVNRMLDPDAGQIAIDGVDIMSTDAVRLRRGIGYVIQQIGLFPHRTVAANVGTVCRLQGWSKADTRERVTDLLDLVGLPAGDYGPRYPHQLSGGQQQRVGVARALAANPPILLLDEPFGALDPVIRRNLQAEFREWVGRLGTTVIFVSHDVEEAMIVGDRMAVMDGRGGIDQIGAPLEVLTAPATEQVVDFLGPARPLRRLAVMDIPMDDLGPARVHESRVPAHETVETALIALLQPGVSEVSICDDEGTVLGSVDLVRVGTWARRAVCASP